MVRSHTITDSEMATFCRRARGCPPAPHMRPPSRDITPPVAACARDGRLEHVSTSTCQYSPVSAIHEWWLARAGATGRRHDAERPPSVACTNMHNMRSDVLRREAAGVWPRRGHHPVGGTRYMGTRAVMARLTRLPKLTTCQTRPSRLGQPWPLPPCADHR